MTDVTHHTPQLRTEADAAADLAGLPRPVSSEDARSLADEMDTMSDRITRYSNSGGDGMLAIGAETIRTLVSERDALAVRVTELETEVLDQCRLNGMGAERELALMGRVRELEAALGFYADPERYHGANQRAIGDRDPFTAKEAPYMQDVTRDRGAIARAALSTTPESKP